MSPGSLAPETGPLGEGSHVLQSRESGGWRMRMLPVLALVVTVAALGLLPVLRTPNFYFLDDSEAVFLPTWRSAGADLLQGIWPTMRPDFWMGGNWAVEAQFGLWSPVNLGLMMVVALIPDLIVAATVVKISFALLLASGAFALAREHGARPWPAMALASALPFAGFTLYFDTSTWTAGLMAFAWTPWFWWVARRVGRGVLNPAVLFLVGYLLMTNGNPYGALAAVIVLAGVALERLLDGDVRGVLRLVVAGLCVGATAGVAYLPLVLSSDVGWREASGLVNDGQLVPDLSMLVATSTPSMAPFIRVWVPGAGTSVPLAYSAWYLVPLLPWLRWSALAGQRRSLAGLGVVGGLYLLLALGPSILWLFRWPARLLQYVWLPAFVLVAVLVGSGFSVQRWRHRAAASGALVAVGAWLAISAQPQFPGRHLASLVLHAVLVAALVWLVVRRPRWVPTLLVAGTAVVLAAQLAWMPLNRDVAQWRFPADAASRASYAAQYRGPVLQIATPEGISVARRPEAWRWLLFGSMPGATGVESVTSYTGIGNDAFSETLCMNHAGATCAGALDRAFRPGGELVPVPRLVDALRVNTVVVSRTLVPGAPQFALPAGWERVTVNEQVVVFQRTGDIPWPDSRLAAWTPGVRVASARATSTTERVVVSTGATGGAVQFARLKWPGYEATVAGAQVEVTGNAEGLVEIRLPAGLSDAELNLTYHVPGYGLAVPLLLGAGALAVAHGIVWGVWRHRAARRRDTGPAVS